MCWPAQEESLTSPSSFQQWEEWKVKKSYYYCIFYITSVTCRRPVKLFRTESQNHANFWAQLSLFLVHQWIFDIYSYYFKGTVRPDWICMRVVPLERPLKGHQPLYVFDFLISVLNIWNNFKAMTRFMQNWIQSSCLFGSRFACAQAAIFFAEPYSINAGEASIVLWIAAR